MLSVAPHVGAWIETRHRDSSTIRCNVAPHVGCRLSKFAPNVTYAEGDRLWEDYLQSH